MSRVGFGLIGCGSMGVHLATQANQVEGAKVVAVCDPDQERASQASSKLGGVPTFANHNDMLSLSEVNAVIIASPNSQHAPQACDAAKAGKHIFCEKPMAPTLEECDRMIQAAKEAGVKLMISQVLRFFPVFQETIRLVSSGVIGEPRAVRIARTGGAKGIFESGWRTKYAHTGGILMEINAHELDFMRVLCGDVELVNAVADQIVHGVYDYHDTFFVEMRFRSGAIGCLHSSIADSIGGYHMVIQGTKGTLMNEGFGGPIRYAEFDGEQKVIQASEIQAEEPYHHELRLFVEAVLEDKEPPITGLDGRAAVELAIAAYRSANTRNTVRLPLGIAT